MKAIVTTVAMVLAASLVHAADAEHSDKTTVDHSKNPITGTETTTKKHTKKMHNDATGAKSEVTTKEKVKAKKDGTVSKETTVEQDSVNK